MTTTEDETPAPPAEPPEPPAIEAAGPDPARDAVWTRGILPLALPILSAVAIAVWVVNISRAFLAGGKQGALVIVMIVTVTIMVGAALMSATPRMRSSTQIMLTVGFIAVIISAGLVSLGPSEAHEGAGSEFVEPKGDAVATVTVEALSSLKFQADEFSTQAGINELEYVGKGGNHTLLFEEQTPEVLGFELAVTGTKTDSSKAKLKPNDYTIYCNVPGHRAAGMEATLKVQ